MSKSVKSKSVEVKLKKFYDKYWPLPRVESNLTDDEISALDRKIWYCNGSECPIPELQKFNTSKVILEYPKDDDCLARTYYHNRNTDYRVYPCGHAFLDIHLLCIIFDYVDYFTFTEGSEPQPSKIFENMANYCPMCTNKDMNCGNAKNMYGRFNQYRSGTVCVKTTVPEQYLQYLKDIYEEGDVVDTEGYRGLGLMYFNGKDFEDVPRIEYYPDWDLARLKKHGYRKLHSALKWNGAAQFDGLELENGIKLYPHGFSEYVGMDDLKVSKYVVLKKNGIRIVHNEIDNIAEKKSDGFYEVKYPFESIEQFKAYASSGIDIKAKISAYDYLVFKDKDIYLTDLAGANKLELAWY